MVGVPSSPPLEGADLWESAFSEPTRLAPGSFFGAVVGTQVGTWRSCNSISLFVGVLVPLAYSVWLAYWLQHETDRARKPRRRIRW